MLHLTCAHWFSIIVTSRDKEKADRTPAKKTGQPRQRTDPKAARYRKCSPAGRQGSSPPEATMASNTQSAEPVPQPGRYTIHKRERGRDWMVIDPHGELVCITVYKRGATEVVRRLTE